MNRRSRQVALYAIGLTALLASIDALFHSYAGLYGWAAHHRLSGWQALTWPAEIDVFLVVGELALYVAYLDGWPGRHRVWPWTTAVTGLVISVTGNVGHVQPLHGMPVTLADRLTAATSPVAAFAGLMVGLLVLKMSGKGNSAAVPSAQPASEQATEGMARVHRQDEALLTDAAEIITNARANGRTVSQRALAAQLRNRGHRFSNGTVRNIVGKAGATTDEQAA